MSATEEVIEQIPDAVVEDTVQIVTVARNNPYILAGVALVAGGLGAFGGYKFAQSRLRMYYEDIARKEIEEAKVYYSTFRKEGSASDPETLLAETQGPGAVEALKAHRRYLGEAEAPAETETEIMSDEERALHEKNGVTLEREETEVTKTERRSVFEGTAPIEHDNFNLEQEVLERTGEKPYVITHDEFYENELDYEQVHVVYFQGDNVLVDERDQVIPDEEATVGEDNLTRFGHGSKDENIVYIRNENLECDFEVTRSYGKYAVEVLGLDDVDEKGLKHSDHQGGVRKFRRYDE